MTATCRPCWRNCAQEPDSEIREIDSLEDAIAPVPPNIRRIRDLISSLELCHHKADRWIHNIIEAIGAGDTRKGLGTRTPGPEHAAEKVWQNACAALSEWCAGYPGARVDLTIGNVPASQFLDGLGERSPLKVWQVQRVIEKIRSVIHFPQSCDDPAAQYTWLLLGGGEYESFYRNECPERYREHEPFWQETARTIIHDTVNGREAKLSLALAIDMLWPCHWNFPANLRIVLEAIGGKLNSSNPFAACARNIDAAPIRDRMDIVTRTLKSFCGEPEYDQEMDRDLLDLLGEPTKEKQWLAASLDKTIRLQLNPSAEPQALSALSDPEWLNEE